MIKLTEIEIVPVRPNKGLVAFASFILNDSFFIGDVAIYTRIDQPENNHHGWFVRVGETTEWSAVRAMNTKILNGDTQHVRATLAHVLTVDWRPEGSVVAEVSLFNEISYRVYLTNDSPGRVWWDLRHGHVFDIGTRTITPVSTARRILIERP